MRRSFTLLFLFFACHAFAQHELAMDIKPLFRTDNNVNVLYRHHDGKKALRLQAGVLFNAYAFDITNSSSTAPLGVSSYTNTNNITNVRADLKIGFQHALTEGEWKLYLGSDAMLGMGFYDGEYTQVSPGQFGTLRAVTRQSNNDFYFGASPLIGISYVLNNRVSFSLENSFPLIYTISDIENSTRTLLVDNTGKESELSVNKSNQTNHSFDFQFGNAVNLRLYVGIYF